MKCPKCNHSISENDLSCPNCSKVLKLKCPQCSTVSKKNICPECEYTMLSKCFKCGKLNPTNQSNCSKCGMNIVASIALKEAVIDKFAVLCLEIINFEVINKVFDSKKTLKQFKDNLYNIIKSQAIDSKVRVQDIGNILIIRFCKDEDYKESCLSAINFALNISQLITEINKKLYDLKKVYLKIKINVSKGDFSDNKTHYEAGRSVEVIYGSEKGNEIYKNIQILVDSYVYKSTKSKYPFQSLSSVFVKDEMITFYELLINKVLKLPEEDEDKSFMNLPGVDDFVLSEEEQENLPLISLTEKKCSFIKVKPDELYEQITQIINSGISNPIINVKGRYETGKLSNINVSDLSASLNNVNVFNLSCTKQSKFYPFGLFRNIIKSYYKVSEYGLFFSSTEPGAGNKIFHCNSHLRDLLNLNVNKKNNPDELRYKFFENISSFFHSINKKTLFIIEDFENIDRGSLDIFKYLIENHFLGNVGFIISCDSDFYLHRHIYKLISQENFYELELSLSSNKDIVNSYRKNLKEIEKSFFFRKIVENMKGSKFYFVQALDYLVENEILNNQNGIYSVNQNKMIVIPPSLDELVKKRLSSMMKDEKIFTLYVMIVLLGSEVPVNALKLLNNNELESQIAQLNKRNLIEITDSKLIKVKNYNLYKENLLSLLEKEKLTEIATNLCETVLTNFDSPHPIVAECQEYANSKKEAFGLWNQLADTCLSLGDFATYINCCTRYLNLIEDTTETEDAAESTQAKSADVIKLEIYEQISILLYRHYPEKIFNYLKALIENAEEAEDDKRVKNLSNIMVQSCLLSGNYRYALEYIGKVISRTPKSSFDPSNKDFNLSYYLTNLVTIEIYFNLGKLEDCIELGEEIFKSIISKDIKMLLPQDFSPKRFKEILKETQILVCIARIIQLKQNTVQKIQELINFYSEDSTAFETLLGIYNLIIGDFTNFNQSIQHLQAKSGHCDSQTKTIYLIYKLLYYIQAQQWNEAGNTAHFTKKFASECNMHQISLFLDLIIGFAYNKIGNAKKARQIYYDILKLSAEKGLMNVTILNWYLLAEIEFDHNNIDVALGILNKAMSTIEKDQNTSKLFTLNFKFLLAKLFAINGDLEKAVYCANHAFEITIKYNLVHKTPECGSLLSNIYQGLIQREQDQAKIDFYQEKVNQVNMYINNVQVKQQ